MKKLHVAIGVSVLVLVGGYVAFQVLAKKDPRGWIDAALDTPSPITAVQAQSPQAVVASSALAAGTYWSAKGGASCTVQNLALPNGRTQSQMTCTPDSDEGTKKESSMISIGNGTISTGHPYETQLKGKGIDQRRDVGNYSWGIVMNVDSQFFLGGCGWFRLGGAVGVQQFGDQILVSLDDGNAGMKCVGTLNRLMP